MPLCEALDDILDQIIERDASIAEVVARRRDRETVRDVEWLIRQSERQRVDAALGRAFAAGLSARPALPDRHLLGDPV